MKTNCFITHNKQFWELLSTRCNGEEKIIPSAVRCAPEPNFLRHSWPIRKTKISENLKLSQTQSLKRTDGFTYCLTNATIKMKVVPSQHKGVFPIDKRIFLMIQVKEHILRVFRSHYKSVVDGISKTVKIPLVQTQFPHFVCQVRLNILIGFLPK